MEARQGGTRPRRCAPGAEELGARQGDSTTSHTAWAPVVEKYSQSGEILMDRRYCTSMKTSTPGPPERHSQGWELWTPSLTPEGFPRASNKRESTSQTLALPIV